MKRRIQLGCLLILMVLAAISELLSIGSVLPFLALLTSPERVFGHPMAQPLVHWVGATSPGELLIPLTAIFCVAALITGGLRLWLLWAIIKVSFLIGGDFDINIYRRTLYQPYSVHVARNSSEIISGISSKANVIIYGTIIPILTLATSAIMLVMIIFGLLAIDPLITVAALAGFGLIYATVIGLSKNKLKENGRMIAKESTSVIKALQEGLGGIRDVLIDGSQEVYCKVYSAADLALRNAQGSNKFIAQWPRYATESLGMLMIAILALFLAQGKDGWGAAIPILGTLALAAQRLLPVMQQAYTSWSSVRGDSASLQDALDLLDQPLSKCVNESSKGAIPFVNKIEMRDVSLQYPDSDRWAVNGVSLTIERGDRIGLVGRTGCGKSTLTDILMGLLEPTTGALLVDGQKISHSNIRSWQAHIAHVPQFIYLADATIEENIAFGVPRNAIDKDRVIEAAKRAQISDVIESLPNGYETCVGERGVRLSGGQRQRIGIARALYKRADVIIFDEATSALDKETERSIMRSLEKIGQGVTVVIVAHRLTTLYACSKIVELEKGEIKRICSYGGLVGGAEF